jgi:hypothetical protein
MITSFATEFMQRNKVTEKLDITASILEEFQIYSSERGIQPPVGEWSRERAWVQNRIKQEIFNQAFSVAKGDEIEAERDPAVRAALERLVSRL